MFYRSNAIHWKHRSYTLQSRHLLHSRYFLYANLRQCSCSWIKKEYNSHYVLSKKTTLLQSISVIPWANSIHLNQMSYKCQISSKIDCTSQRLNTNHIIWKEIKREENVVSRLFEFFSIVSWPIGFFKLWLASESLASLYIKWRILNHFFRHFNATLP